MNLDISPEVARARSLRAQAAELCERLQTAVDEVQAALVRSRACSEDLRTVLWSSDVRRRVGTGSGSGREEGGAAPGSLQIAVHELPGSSAIYTVYLEGGTFSQAKRSSAVERYRQVLEANYGSAVAVIDAMTATDAVALQRWASVRAYARWSALAPYEFAGKGDFQIRHGPAFTSG